MMTCIAFSSKKAGGCPGQSLLEYTLIGALIAVVAIGGLSMLGLSTSNIFSNMIQHKPQPVAQPQAGTLQVTNAATGTANSGSAQTGGTTVNAATIEASSAQQVVTQTTGANGATESYTQNIIKAAQKSLAAGTINQSDYDLIMQLANKGHEIATMQGLMQQAYETNNENGTITFNGQSTSVSELNFTLYDSMDEIGALLNRIGTSLNYSNKDPSLLQTIESNCGSINTLIRDIYSPTPGAQSQYDTLRNAGGASNATNQSSANICAAGQHLDVNNHCVY